jgi:hypothetical protein
MTRRAQVGCFQEVFGRPNVRRGSIPGAGGIMNARGVARLFAMLANEGELDGVRLPSAERLFAMLRLGCEKGLEPLSSARATPWSPRYAGMG